MEETTSHNWDRLSEGDQEAIEEALDRWESSDPESRHSDLSEYCADARLLPYVEERIGELQEIERFATDVGEGRFEHATLTSIDSIQVTETISRRSTCDVYKGTQDNPKRVVAVKVFKGAGNGSKYAKRFTHEIRLLAKLRHSSIAEIYFAGDCESKGQRLLYFAMEYVDGPAVTAYADQRDLSIRDRVALFLDVCQAVGHAHQRGVIHRDLKPSNVLTTKEGQAKVLDFGIAKSIDPSDTAYTEIGVGTPAYMSPEQFDEASEQSIHSDIYSLGVLLYELVSGRSPYGRKIESMAHAAKVICDGDLVNLRECCPDCPIDLAAITHKCLQKLPEDRYQSVSELAADLQNFLSGKTVSARQRSPVESLTRWVAGNRVASFSIFFAAASLLAGAVTAFWYWRTAEGVVKILHATVSELDTARGSAERARDSLREELNRSQRSQVNNVLALADRHWRSNPDLVSQWLDGLTLDKANSESFAWRVHRHRADRVAAELKAHAFPVVDIAYFPSENVVVAASETGLVSAWDLKQRTPIWEKEMGLQDVRSCDAHPAGQGVLAVDKTELVLIDLKTGKSLRRVEAGLPYVVRAEFSPSGDLIVAYGDADEISVWDATLSEQVFDFKGSFDGFHAVAIDRNSTRLMAVGRNGNIAEWSLDDGGLVYASQISTKNLNDATISSRLTDFATAEKYTWLSTFDRSRLGSVDRHLNRRERFDRLFYSADDEWLITQGRKQFRGRSRASDWSANWTQRAGDRIRSAVPTDDPNLFAVGLFDGRVQLRWINPPAIDVAIAENLALPKQICVGEEGDRVVVVGDSVSSFNVATGKKTRDYPVIETSNPSSAWHSSGTLDVASGKRKQLLRIGPGADSWDSILQTKRSITAVAYDESAGKLITGLGGGEISIVGDETGTLATTFQAHAVTVSALATETRRGDYVSGSEEGELAFWGQDNQRLAQLKPHSNAVADITISPDGKLVYSVCHDGKLVITDADRAVPLVERVLMAGRIHAVAISPDGETLAVGGADPNILLLDAITGELQATLQGHTDYVTDLAFTPDGNSLLSVSADATLRRWTPTE